MKRIVFISLIISFVLLTICCNRKSKSTNPDTEGPDFAIQVTPQTQGVMAGNTTEFQIELISANDFSAPCTLSVAGLPDGDSAALDPEVLTPPESYKLVVGAKNGNISRADTTTLAVSSNKVTDYYPLALGNSWTYVFLDEFDQIWNTITYTILDTATISGNLSYILSPADSIYVYVKEDTIFSKSGEIILAGPLVVGQTWNAYFWKYEVVEFGTIILINNSAEYERCLKIKKTDPSYPGDETFEWWAEDVGRVKIEEHISGQYKGTMELESFTHY